MEDFMPYGNRSKGTLPNFWWVVLEQRNATNGVWMRHSGRFLIKATDHFSILALVKKQIQFRLPANVFLRLDAIPPNAAPQAAAKFSSSLSVCDSTICSPFWRIVLSI